MCLLCVLVVSFKKVVGILPFATVFAGTRVWLKWEVPHIKQKDKQSAKD
jgi:hypothetical protein